MYKKVKNFFLNRKGKSKDEKGQGLAEYAVVLIVIVLAAVVALSPVGNSIESVGTSVSGTIDQKVTDLQSGS